MKRVLLIDYNVDKMGGVERVICTLANSLLDYYDVQMCSVYKHSGAPYYDYDKRVGITYLIDNSRCLSTKMKSQLGFLLARVPEKVIELTYYNARIREYVQKSVIDKVDVVIFGRRASALDFLPYMDDFAGKIIVREANHYYYTDERERERLRRIFPNRVDTFILSSQENLEAYRRLFHDKAIRLRKLYNPIGISIGDSVVEREKSIIGVGRFSRQKGFELLIEAYAIVHNEYPDWKLKLIGDGTYKQKYVKMCRKRGLSNCVEMYPSSTIVEEYQKAGIYVMTSRDEGYANSLVEAMACGTPSISVDWVMGVREIVIDSVNGIIVPLKDRMKYFCSNDVEKEDIRNLADSILCLIKDDIKRKVLGMNASAIVCGREKETIIKEWIGIIEE